MVLLHNEGIGFLVHAICCIFVYSSCLFPITQYWGCVFLLYELSTPLLHLRHFMVLLKKTDTTFFQIVQVSFALVFFIVRIVMGFYMSFYWYLDVLPPFLEGKSHSSLVMGIFFPVNIALNLLNGMWMYKIIRNATRSHDESSSKSAKKSS